jgi:hypothetical protein
MPFRPQHLGPAIRGARGDLNRSINATPTPSTDGAAQRAKESAYKWLASGMGDPARDGASPWFSGQQPFTQTRMQHAGEFDEWKNLFRNETDMGWNFAPPPPPEPSGSPGNAGNAGGAGGAGGSAGGAKQEMR